MPTFLWFMVAPANQTEKPTSFYQVSNVVVHKVCLREAGSDNALVATLSKVSQPLTLVEAQEPRIRQVENDLSFVFLV